MSVSYGRKTSSTISITGLTTAQMKDQSNYTDWNFTNIWGIDVSSPKIWLQVKH